MVLQPSLSFIQKRILLFFQEHPHAVETIRGVATWVGGEEKLIEEALKGLVGRKWLLAHETSAVTGYSLTRDERHLGQIRKSLGLEPSL